MSDLTVITVNVGDRYSADYTSKMCSMVNRHYDKAFQWVPITDEWNNIPPSWWHKIRAFNPKYTGQVLVLDLDQIILKDLNSLLSCCDPEKLTCYADHIGWHGCRFGSAFMYFPGGKFSYIYEAFIQNPEAIMEEWDQKGGDQAFINRLVPDKDKAYLEDILGYRPALSYKFDQLDEYEPDEDAFIVNFHGEPKPHQIETPPAWILDNWK